MVLRTQNTNSPRGAQLKLYCIYPNLFFGGLSRERETLTFCESLFSIYIKCKCFVFLGGAASSPRSVFRIICRACRARLRLRRCVSPIERGATFETFQARNRGGAVRYKKDRKRSGRDFVETARCRSTRELENFSN